MRCPLLPSPWRTVWEFRRRDAARSWVSRYEAYRQALLCCAGAGEDYSLKATSFAALDFRLTRHAEARRTLSARHPTVVPYMLAALGETARNARSSVRRDRHQGCHVFNDYLICLCIDSVETGV